MPTTPAPTAALPRPFLVWLGGVTVGRLGDAVLAFGLGWAAAGHGGTTAALVLTLSGLPRLVLLVLGGAVADRFGARRSVSLGVLVAVRELGGPADGAPGPGAARRPRLDLPDGVRVAARTPGLGRALVLTGAGAALMLPVPSLLVPLLGRASGWGAGTTGAVAGAAGVGAIAAALLLARRRATGSALSAVHGLAASAAGALVLAGSAVLATPGATVVAVAGALVLGLGQGVFVARLAPLVLGTAPRTHLARVQALVGLAQIAPVMVTNTLLGALAERASPAAALAATGAGLLACAAWARRPAPPGPEPERHDDPRAATAAPALDPRAGRGPTVGA